MTTKPFLLSAHTLFFSSMILHTRSSMNFLSAFTSLSRSSALLQKKPEFTSLWKTHHYLLYLDQDLQLSIHFKCSMFCEIKSSDGTSLVYSKENQSYLRFLVFQRHVAGQDVSVLHSLLHVRMSGAVVQHQTSDQAGKEKAAYLQSRTISEPLNLQERNGTKSQHHQTASNPQLLLDRAYCLLRIAVRLVFHLHDLHHVKVNGFIRFPDGQHSVHHRLRKRVRGCYYRKRIRNTHHITRIM